MKNVWSGLPEYRPFFQRLYAACQTPNWSSVGAVNHTGPQLPTKIGPDSVIVKKDDVWNAFAYVFTVPLS
jgi:hypothetical protein